MLNHPLNILHYVGVRHPHNPEPLSRQPCRPPTVIFFLERMSIAVDFNHKLGFGTEKVGDEWTQPNLAAKFVAAELTGPEVCP